MPPDHHPIAQLAKSIGHRALCSLAAWVIWLAFTIGSFASDVLLPDLPNVVRPSPEPSYPAGFDPYTPPVSSVTPSAQAPAVAEWTRTGGADDTLAVTGARFSFHPGSDFGKDTRFICFGQSTASNSLLSDARIQRLDPLKAAVTLDANLPWSMCLVWPVSQAGAGYPLAVNRTEAWWIGPDKATRQQKVSVYGRNLSHDNGETQSWVLLKPSDGGTGRWTTVTAANPYKVDFMIPSDTTNGIYEVWVHNGHGGRYGWSVASSLTVDDGFPWTTNILNVRDYGAAGNGVADDTAAVKAALTAAGTAAWSTVRFPAGSYMISSSLAPPDHVRWLGEGKGLSFIKAGTNWTSGSLISRSGMENVEFRNLTFDGNLSLPAAGTVFNINNAKTVIFTNTAVVAHRYTIMNPSGSNRLRLLDSEFTGNGFFVGWIRQFLIERCSFYGTDDCNVMLYQWGGLNVSMTDSFMADFDCSTTTNGNGWSQGRWYTGSGNWGPSRLTYLGNNTSSNLAVRPGFWNQNTGEQFMWEGYEALYSGIVTAATPTTISFGNYGSAAAGQHTVFISAGVGLGQSRLVTGVDSATKTLTVSPPWTLTPEPGSRANLGSAPEKVACYGNRLDGKSSYPTQDTASVGIEPYEGCLDFIAVRNTMTDMRRGAISEHALMKGPTYLPVYFPFYAENTASNCLWGARVNGGWTTNADMGCLYLGGTYRKNRFYNMSQMGWTIGNASTRPETFDLLILEHNVCSNLPMVVDYTGGTQDHRLGTVLYRNQADRGTAALAGSVAIDLTRSQRAGFRENGWHGFQTVYGGTTPGPVLELPQRVLHAEGRQYGSPVVVNLEIWNIGSAALSWTLSDTTGWLVPSVLSGTLPDEQSVTHVPLTLDPVSLGKGVYTGVVTVASGTQVQRATVVFAVGTNSAFGAFWRFDENSGTGAMDSSGNGNTAALRNGADWVQGVIGSAVRFDGTNDYVAVSNSVSLNPSNALSLSAWVRSDTANWNADGVLVSKADGYALSSVAGSKQVAFRVRAGGTWVSAAFTPSIDLTVWHHYACSYNGNDMRVYIDGQCVATNPCTGAVEAGSGPLVMGCNDGMSRYFGGMLDEVAVYKQALSGSEIGRIYSNGVNHVPVADPHSVTTTVNRVISFRLTASDPDGVRDALAFGLVSMPLHGTLTGMAPDLTYTPQSNFAGSDSFVFKVNDGREDSPPATVSITIRNTAPVADPQNLGTTINQPLQMILTGSDPDDEPLSFQVAANPAHGVLSGTIPTVTYTPTANYAGSDSFTFKAHDGHTNSPTATISITIAGTNRYVSPYGSHTLPYDTWARAATTLQAAVTAASFPETVWITNGTYRLTNQISLAKAVTVRSVNGAAVTIVDADYPARTTRCFSVNHTNAVLDGLTLRNGSLTSGGGLLLDKGLVRNCTIASNRGTGVRINGGLLVDSTIERNWPQGVNMTGGTLDRCIIRDNSDNSPEGNTHGGGIYMDNGLVRNCLISGNSCAYDGGGIRINNGRMENCTVVRNNGRSGAIYRAGGAVLNTISCYNNLDIWENGDGFRYCASPSFVPDPLIGNINTEPGFADPGAGLGVGNHAGDYRLTANSTCLDTGSNELWMAGGVDLDRNSRLAGNGSVDRGAWEFGPLTCSFRADKLYGSSSQGRNLFRFTSFVNGINTSGLIYAWDFNGDGVIDSQGTDCAVPDFSYLSPGVYNVTLTVRNAAGEIATSTRKTYIQVVDYYVSPLGGHVSPFVSWATAATNIQAAVNVAQAGCVVFVSNGLYRSLGPVANNAMVSVTKDITMIGVGGWTNTILDGYYPARTNRCLYVNHANAIIRGVALTNGFEYEAAGLYLAKGTVEDCLLRGNAARNGSYPKAGAARVDAGGLLKNCLVTDNDAEQNGAIHCSGGTVQGCTIFANRRPYGLRVSAGLVRDCFVTNNIYGDGAIIDGGVVSNCVFEKNPDGGMTLNGGLAVNCVLARHNASGHGAGIDMQSGAGVARNCLIYGNSAQYDGGGISIRAAAGVIENCTIVGNAGRSGDGLYATAGTIRNTIVYFNDPAGGGRNIYGTAAFDFCCSPDLTNSSGIGNINSNPKFVNAGSGYGTTLVAGNYRLSKSSPCINAGTNAAWMNTTVDLIGSRRILDHVVDMGPYESLYWSAGTVIVIR